MATVLLAHNTFTMEQPIQPIQKQSSFEDLSHSIEQRLKKEFLQLQNMPSPPSSPSNWRKRSSFEFKLQVCDEVNFEHPMENTSAKNRYPDIVPFEQTRVRLEKNGGNNSDYINASYLDGEVPNSSKAYIACQAPLESTTDDFWRMIWEQNCGVIVMLTGLREGNRIKADQYWPEQGQVKKYGNILVCNKNTFTLGSFIVRSLLVREKQQNDNDNSTSTTPSPQVREIIQIQYSEWPDFGIPESTKPIRDLICLMAKMQERASTQYALNGPAVIHCSAGVGRTGTFIAAHITLEKLRHHYSPNIFETVAKLRQQRPRMVCTEAQYTLIYQIVRDFIKVHVMSNGRRNLKRSCPDSSAPSFQWSAVQNSSLSHSA